MSKAVKEFQFQETQGVLRTAKIENTRSRMTGWTDPGWFVKVPGGQDYGDACDGLTYLGTDGDIWITKIHTGGGFLDTNIKPSIHFESYKKSNESGNNRSFQFVDWQGGKWNVDDLQLDQKNVGEYEIALLVTKF